MTATPGITKSLAEKIADAHEILGIYTEPFLQDGNEKVTALRIHREFADATTMEPCGSSTTRVPEDDWSAVLALLHDRATARLAALQDEARKALGVPEVSPPVAAPTFKVGDRVRVIEDDKFSSNVGRTGFISTIHDNRVIYPFVVDFDDNRKPVWTSVFRDSDIELIPSPLSGDFISEADDARLVRVGRVLYDTRGHQNGPKQREAHVGSISGTPRIKVRYEGEGVHPEDTWETPYENRWVGRLTEDARLTLRTAELTLTADERAKVEAAT